MMHKLYTALLVILLATSLSGQYGSINVLGSDGTQYLFNLCDITYVTELGDGTADIHTASGQSVITAISYDAVLAMSCGYLLEYSDDGQPTNPSTAVSVCNITNLQEYMGQGLGVGISDGKRLCLLCAWDDCVAALECDDTIGTPTDKFLIDASIIGNDIVITMTDGVTFMLPLSTFDTDTYVTSGTVNNNCELILSYNTGPDVTIPLGDCAGGGGDTDTDDQTVDLFQIIGNDLCISLEDDNEPIHCVDLASLNSDQFIDFFNLANNELCISLSDDGVPPLCVDLDNLNISLINDLIFDCVTGELVLDMITGQDFSADLSCLVGGGGTPITLSCVNGLLTATTPTGSDSVDLAACGIDTDDQCIDQFALVGSTIFISLEDDNKPPLTIDIGGIVNDQDNQMIQTFNLDCVTGELTIQLEDDITGGHTVDLSCLDFGGGTDLYVQNGNCNGGFVELVLINGSIVSTAIPCGDAFTDTDDQTLNANWNCTTGVLTLELEDDPNGVEVIDMSCLITNADVFTSTLDCVNGFIQVTLNDGSTINTAAQCGSSSDLVIADVNCVNSVIEITLNDGSIIVTATPCTNGIDLFVDEANCINGFIELTLTSGLVFNTTVPCVTGPDLVIADLNCNGGLIEITLSDGLIIPTTTGCDGSWSFTTYNEGTQTGPTQAVEVGDNVSIVSNTPDVLGVSSSAPDVINFAIFPGSAVCQVLGTTQVGLDLEAGWVDLDDCIEWGDITLSCNAGVLTVTLPDGSAPTVDLTACGLGGGGGDIFIQSIDCVANLLQVTLNDASVINTTVPCGAVTDTDDQCFDVAQLVGTNLQLSLDDCATIETIDMSSLLNVTNITSLNPENLVITEPTTGNFNIDLNIPPCSQMGLPAGRLCYEACDGNNIVLVSQ